MGRTNTTLVQNLLGVNYDTVRNPDLQQFIDSADVIVNRVVQCAAAKSQAGGMINFTLSDGFIGSEAEIVERWLAAHLYCQQDQMYASKNTEAAAASFQGQWGLDLDSTNYGRSAMIADFSGCLNAIAKRKFASATWLGLPPSAQTDASDRGW
jgi:hypothetical protein